MSAKKKVPVVNVQFKIVTEVNVEITADSLAQALDRAASYKHSDLVKVAPEVDGINDYSVEVTGAFI